MILVALVAYLQLYNKHIMMGVYLTQMLKFFQSSETLSMAMQNCATQKIGTSWLGGG